MLCYFVATMLTRYYFFSRFSQLCYCLFWHQLFLSSSFYLCGSSSVSPSLLSESVRHIINHAQSHPQFVHHHIQFMLSLIICQLAWYRPLSGCDNQAVQLAINHSSYQYKSVYRKVTTRLACSRRKLEKYNLQVILTLNVEPSVCYSYYIQPTREEMWQYFNALKTKRRLLYLNTQFVLRSKHFSFRL